MTRTPGQWRTAILKTEGLKAGPRLYLTYLAEHMNQKRIVSRPRHLIARDLGVSMRTVDYWNTAAVEAQLLAIRRRGQKGVTAVYEGLFPDVQRASCLRAETDAKLRAEHAETPVQRAKDCAPVVPKTSARSGTAPSPYGHNGSSKDEQVPSRASAPAPRPWWHREPPDLEEPEPYADREESA